MAELALQLNDLRGQMARLTSLIQQSADLAVQSIFSTDLTLAQRVDEMDTAIDLAEVQIELRAMDLVKDYHPVGDELRWLVVIIKANHDFERIADCAVNAAQRVMPLVRGHFQCSENLRLICTGVLTTLRDTINAFNLRDDSMAREVLLGDDALDAIYMEIVEETLCQLRGGAGDANVELSNIMIAKNMERIGDHCTNVAEHIIFAQTGQIVRHQHRI